MSDDHLKPSKEECKLDCEEEWVEQIQLRLCVSHWQAVSLLRRQYLPSAKVSKKVKEMLEKVMMMMMMIYLVRLLIVRNDPLGANNSSAKVGVNRQGDHLIIFHNLATFHRFECILMIVCTAVAIFTTFQLPL